MTASTKPKTPPTGEQMRQRLPETPILFNDVDLAAEFGGTHVTVGHVPFRYNDFLPDNSDPYPAWSQTAVSLFRVFPPPALQPWIPADIVHAYRTHLDAQYAALRRHGLRAIANGHEPMWLPEAVFEAHPRWRGGQCELGRIAAKPYFTPSIDDPEVRELYRWSMREWCRTYPETDGFSFWTNDCGAGIPWSVYAYPGPNGPMKYRMRDPGERIAGWLEAMRAGAGDAGCDLRIHVHSFSFPPADTAAIRAKLGERLYLNNTNGKGEPLNGGGASCDGDKVANPVAGLCHPLAFIKSLAALPTAENRRMRSITCGDHTRDMAHLILDAFLAEPAATGVAWQARIVERVATKLAGAEQTTALVDVWEKVELACHAVRQIRQRGLGLVIPFGLTTARWLVRPLVPQPLLLTDEETAHYRDYLFSTGTPEQDASLCYILGKPVLRGDGVVWMTRWCLHEAINTLTAARGRLAALIPAAPAESRQALALYEARLGVFACLLECARCAILFQHAVSIADQPRFGANPLDFDDNMQFDQRALEMRKLARADLDNTMELIDLLQAHPQGALIEQSETPQNESVFTFGPNLIEGLRKKMAVTLSHWHDYERLYPTAKVDEFEPRDPQSCTFLPEVYQ